ncbi:MAG: DNA polymerase III subunit delta [Gemmatimonadetes bacterium]|nr:DNA polymerase III subunit delta [Gemmatimonadota bacterium]
MALITADQLAKRLAAGGRGGIFFLFGENEFLKERAAAQLVAAHLDPATRDFNLDQLRATETDPDALASIAHTPPMMAEWRVVVVRDAQALAASARSRGPIEALLSRPLSGLVLILLATLPDRSKAQFFERLKREAVAVEFQPLGEADLPGWLMETAAEHGLKLDAGAARARAGAIGADLGILTQELAKLEHYVGERRRITRADVEAVVGVLPRQNRWDWFDLVAAGDFPAARKGLPVLLDQGESGVGLVIGLGTQFLRLALAAAGGEPALAAALLPHQQWLAGRIARQARRWSRDRLDHALDDLLRADRLLKSAALGDRAVLEELLLRLEHRTPAVSAA